MSLIDAVFGYAPAQVLHVAARLGIADHLATGLKTSDSLAQATQTHEPSLRRLLRALAGLGVLAEFAPGEFELTDDGRVLRGDVPDSIRSTVLHAVSGEAWHTWGELEHTGADLPDELATAPRGGLLDYAFGYRRPRSSTWPRAWVLPTNWRTVAPAWPRLPCCARWPAWA